MALSGTLQTLSLAEIFQTLERSRATGVLRLVSLDGGRDIVFISGNIANVDNRDAQARISVARRLAASGIVEDSSILEAAIAASAAGNSDSAEADSGASKLGSATSGHSIIASLRENGLDEDVITQAIQGQLMDELFDVFTWEQANFEFLEAAGQDQAVSALVDESQQNGISINTNMVLMESARRLDEWQRARVLIPNDHVILSLVDGREQDLAALSDEYPARAIVPFINGACSLAAMIRQSVATRLDIYLVLSDLINQGLVLILTTPQIINNAQSFERAEAFDQAALLYRHALANDPDNPQLRLALAHTLEQQGDSPEAAECYAELAMGYLREGEPGRACDAARRAVELGGDHFERNTYIQCLESAGRIDEATEQMRRLAEYHASLQQWIEAKDICHQILTIIPNDEASLHVICLAFTHTCDLDLEEREISCVHCSQVNHRDKINCDNCGARLHKLCRNCHSETACSDTVCLYCGKSPHVLETEEQSSGLYEQISEQDHRFRSSIQRAVDLRHTGELEKSLAIWKEISHEVTGNQSVHNHIRELESEIHNQRIEKLIGKGNNYRRRRAFARAAKCYQEAQRIVAPRDPRKPRLDSILRACQKDNQRTRVVYIIASVAVLIASWVAVDPFIQYYRFEKDTAIATQEIDSIIRSGGGADSFKKVLVITSTLTTRGAGLSERVRLNLLPIVTGKENEARDKLSNESLELIKTSIAEKDFAKTTQLLANYKTSYGPVYKKEQLDPLSAALRDGLEAQRIADKLLEDAPKLYADADALLAAHKYPQALERYRALSSTPKQDLAQQAQEKVQTLERQKSALEAALQQAAGLLKENIQAAENELVRLQAESSAWEELATWNKLHQQSAALVAAAKVEFNGVKAKNESAGYEAFIAQYPGTNEALQARDLAKNLRNEELAVKTALEKIAAYRAQKDWEQVYLNGRRFVRDFGEAKAADIELPLLINTVPQGATVKVGEQTVGVTPCVYSYHYNATDALSIECPGFDTQHYMLKELQEQYQLSKALNRSIVKSIAVRSSVYRLISLGQGFLVASKGALRFFDHEGAGIATQSVGSLGLLEDDLFKWSQLIQVQDDYLVFPSAADSVTVLDRSGALIKTHQLSQALESQPCIYVNELFGAEPRLAIADNGLASGSVLGTLKPLDKEHQVLAGPVTTGDSLDQLLVFVSNAGQFVGYDEANARVSWAQDSSATHVGNFIQVAPGQYLTTLDDSRLALFTMSLDGVQKVWEKPLPRSIVAAPVVNEGLVYLALRDQVLVYNQKGIQQLSISPNEQVISVSGRKETGIAVGCQSGLVKFYDPQGSFAWQCQLEAQPSALLVVENRVYIGTNKGQVIILAP